MLTRWTEPGNQTGSCYTHVRYVTYTQFNFPNTKMYRAHFGGSTVNIKIKKETHRRKEDFSVRYFVIDEKKVISCQDAPAEADANILSIQPRRDTLMLPIHRYVFQVCGAVRPFAFSPEGPAGVTLDEGA